MDKNTLSVLVVEDDWEDYLLVRTYLHRAVQSQFDLKHVVTLEEALQALVEQEFDIVLADYFLQGNTAMDLLKHLKLTGLDVPVVVLTGGDASDLDDTLMQLGASDFIPKDEVTTGLLERSIRHAIERKRSEQQISLLIKRDPLTGLGNRMIFEEHTELAIARAKRYKNQLAIAFLDLDRFKNVNDTLGHHVGDLLLTLIGSRIQAATRKSDVVARIGGDEFTLMLDNVSDIQSLDTVAEKILAEVMRPAQLDGKLLDVSASMGIAIYPDHGLTVSELMRKADMALYECKTRGAAHHLVFTDCLQARLQKEIRVENGLHRALNNNEFELHYQPVINMQDGSLLGVEALIRWCLPDGTIVMPNDFIQEATRVGLTAELGEWVVEAACQQLRCWLDQGLTLSMSVNISPHHLRYIGFDQMILDTVNKYQIPPSLLILELTEEVFVDSGVASFDTLNALRNVGIKIAIDDFGTGYSSLRYLKTLPIDRIKIDRCFVSEDNLEALSDPLITQAIIYLCQGLGLDLVAEGVESEEQANCLQQQGCMTGQGFLYARPMTADALIEWMGSHATALVSGQP